MATYEPERTRNFYLLGDSQAEMVQLIAADPTSQYRNVIDVSIRDHRLQSVFGIARRELVLHMFVPTI